MMTRIRCSRLRLYVAVLGWAAWMSGGAMAEAAERPNILVILADDCTALDLPLYGGANARTPHIDRLASQGLTFHRAYVGSAMCQPSRSELYTGRYPMRNGAAWNHSASRPGTTSLPQHLGRLGYRVGLAGKVHVAPAEAYPFEAVAGFDDNCVRNPTLPHDIGPARAFMERDPNQPFCLVVALVEPHVPWVMGDPSAYPPDQIALPPNLADTLRTREAFARYLAEITYMDTQVGEILQCLDESGLRDDTLVLFSSEQGAQFPGCKWTNWDAGLRTALVARWPDRVPAGRRTTALVQYADVLPTLMELAGAEPADTFDGTSFLDVLRGQRDHHRDYVYGMHNNVPEGPPYPIRSISDGTHRYIRNLLPDHIYIEKHLMGWTGEGELNNPYWATWIASSWDSPRTYRLVSRYMHRPAEELYNTTDDPYELQNLAGQPATQPIRSRLAAALDLWMTAQGDPGAPQDSLQALEAARRGQHRYTPPE